ncbi:MAG: UDP-N-acetylmuramoyl-L-alanyl-D-glutamate--2,6-diaminopimelate ligase [Ruminococcaceae bacterium]|nr:UDP-N-acetylmuramoyl-L-alanyl-D-glutamate--2,6-diaminopimelate ligase [Oscillospiraceae bacterium]
MLLSRLLFESGIDYDIYTQGSELLRLSAPNTDVKDIFCDSRKVVIGGLYIAMEGVHTDSHAYVAEACEHGAVAAVISRDALMDGRVNAYNCYVPLIAVEDTREAYARLYAAWYSNPQNKLKFIGVTGTNGKTSVCSIIYHVLSSAGLRCGQIGTTGNTSLSAPLDIRSDNANANMTTPDPPELYKILAAMVSDGVEYVIMEVTSHALALRKVAPISFDVAVFTNLSEDHLDFHLNMERYFAAKSLLFSQSRRAVINIDDKYGRRIADSYEGEICTCSAEGRSAQLSAVDVRFIAPTGTEYKLSSHKMRLRVRTSLPGRVNVMNTLEAIAVCTMCGVSPRNVKDAISSFRGIRGRLERIKLDNRADFSVFIDYAHTPDALENLIRTARQMAKRGQRVVLLFGCGGDRERQKRSLMGRIASQMADFFVVTSDNSRSEEPIDIINDIICGIDDGATYTVIEDRRAAIEYVIKNARRGDIILLAGKGHEEYEIDKSGRHPFSEREICGELVKKYYG